jgi:predicted ATPase
VAEILSHVPGVKILVTSRERLNLQWEWPFEVPGLQFPPSAETATPEAYSAIQLFGQSARRAYSGFKLSEAEKPFVVRICQSLRGMPLGIELAAAWVEVSSCQEIAQEIERNMDFLATSRRDVAERHRSLQAAFEHSWGLLSAEERTVLSQLSVFRNGFGRKAAQVVTSANLMYLSALMHKSVLRRSPTGRYEMLEVLRQYADEKLQQSPQTDDETHNLHCGYYAEFLHQRQDRLMGKEQRQTLDEIGAEIDNARAAWRWAVEHQMWEQIDKSLDSLFRFYETRSWLREGEAALGQAALMLAADNTGETDALLAKVLARQGWLCLQLSQFDAGQELLQSSLDAFLRLDLPKETAMVLSRLGVASAWLGHFDEAARLFEESIMISSTVGDPHGLARGLNNIGIVAMILKRHKEAKLILQESLAIAEENGILSLIVDSLANLGLVAEALGEYYEAKEYHQQAQGIYTEIGDRWAVANSLSNLGFVLIALGEYGEARRCFQESLEIAEELQAVNLILEDLIGLAKLLSEDGKKEQALELIASVLDHSAIGGKAKERAEQLLSELKPLLAPRTFAMAREQGKGNDIRHYARLYGVGQPVV